jgi:hypothetical protein
MGSNDIPDFLMDVILDDVQQCESLIGKLSVVSVITYSHVKSQSPYLQLHNLLIASEFSN